MQSAISVVQLSEILRRDKRGRLWMKSERREALLDEFEKSGISAAQFAWLAAVNYSSFQNWVQRRRKRREAKPERLRLLEAVVDNDQQARPQPAPSAPVEAGLVIELPGGGRMRVESPVQLRMAAELLVMMAQTGIGRC